MVNINSHPARSQIRALVCGLPNKWRILRDLMMLQCYVDESVCNDGHVMVMAGFIASAEKWEVFSEEWQECLDMKPRMDYLHMTDAVRSWGTESQERVARFHRIIDNHAIAGVSISIPLAAYRRIFGHVPVWKNPYLFLLFQLVKNYRAHCDNLGLSRNVDFIFDEQLVAMNRVMEAWVFLKENGNERILEILGNAPVFMDDKKVLPLQAADMCAWWIRRQLSDHIKGVEPPKFPWSKKDEIQHLAIRYDEEGLQKDYNQMFEHTSSGKQVLFVPLDI